MEELLLTMIVASDLRTVHECRLQVVPIAVWTWSVYTSILMFLGAMIEFLLKNRGDIEETTEEPTLGFLWKTEETTEEPTLGFLCSFTLTKSWSVFVYTLSSILNTIHINFPFT